MRGARRVTVAGTIAFLLPACAGGPEPLGPTPLDEGIIVYLHVNYSGSSQAIGADVSDLEEVEGPCTKTEETTDANWGDCISSVRVMPGWGATLYRDDSFRGGALEVTADTPDLKAVAGPCSEGFNDCVSSIRVYRR